MEEIEGVIESLHKKRNLALENYGKEEKKQIEYYNDLMKDVKDLKKQHNEYQESINKNIINLIEQKPSVLKLTQNSKQMPGLPISYDCHQEAIQFFSDAIDFINDFQTSDGPLDILQNDNIDKLVTNDIVKCRNYLQNELNTINMAISYIEKAKKNIEILHKLKLSLKSDDESPKSNSSIS